MAGSYGQCYFYSGFSREKERRLQSGQSPKEGPKEQIDKGENRHERQIGEISFFGIKLSYSKAFGIAFLVIFLLLFFPGIGISSSTVQGKAKIAGGEKGDPKENHSNNLFTGRR